MTRFLRFSLALAALVTASVAAAAPMTSATFDALVADARTTMFIDPAATIEKGKQVEREAEALPLAQRGTAAATGAWLQGEAYLRLDDMAHAGPAINRAAQLAKVDRTSGKLTGDILLSRGGFHTAQGSVVAALADYQRAHNIFRALREARSQAIALLYIAGLYQDATDYENALKYYAEALDVYRVDPQLRISILNNRGIVLKELRRFDAADTEFKKALASARAMNSVSLQIPILRNMARNDLAAGRLAEADRAIEQGSALMSGLPDGPLASQMYGIAARAALMHRRYDKARSLIERSFRGVDLARTTISYREAHETAYKIYSALGDDKQALRHLEALKRLDDSTTKLATSSTTSLAAARFDYANQKTRIAQLKADQAERNVAFERARARTQRFVFIGIVGVTVVIVAMLGVGLVTIRRSRNEVRAANIDLAETNTALGKALAAKTEFLATTSHEIRTPLNGILGMTQVMLADASVDARTLDRLNVVHAAGVTMRALVDDILDIAKMETGNMTIEQISFDLCITLHEVSRMWQEQARGKSVEFVLDVADCPSRVVGDPARLRQILFNLLSNALKFTAAGTVTLRSAADPRDPARLLITVSDSGIGIAQDKLEMIFESFRQVDAGTTRQFGGTGLGLAISRNLARAMGGDVTVTSEPGAGSTFTLALPLVADGASADASSLAAPADGLLIVDRNPISRSVLRATLESRVDSVRFAASLEEATTAILGDPALRILVDNVTAQSSDNVADSLAALAKVTAEQGGTVTLLWPKVDIENGRRLLSAGVHRLLSKPIAGPALAAALFDDDTASVCQTDETATQAA